MAKSSVFSIKRGKVKPAHGDAGERIAGSRRGYPDEYLQELTPLEVIKLDTDVLGDDIEYVFKLPPAPPEIADYLGHYFLPAEKVA